MWSGVDGHQLLRPLQRLRLLRALPLHPGSLFLMPIPTNPYDRPDAHMIHAYLNGVYHCSCEYCWRATTEAPVCPRTQDPALLSTAGNQISAIQIDGKTVWTNPDHAPWYSGPERRPSLLRRIFSGS
jgi:hypothetical protein